MFDDEHGEQRIAAAPRQPHPLGKCIASVSLLTYILIAKYADALPLYRLEKILARYGGNISRTAMANWIIRLDDIFRPLINLLQEHQRGGDYLQGRPMKQGSRCSRKTVKPRPRTNGCG